MCFDRDSLPPIPAISGAVEAPILGLMGGADQGTEASADAWSRVLAFIGP